MPAIPPTPVIAQREAAPICWEPLQCVSSMADTRSQLSSLTSCSGRAQLVRCTGDQMSPYPFPKDRDYKWKITADTAMSGLARLPKDLQGHARSSA